MNIERICKCDNFKLMNYDYWNNEYCLNCGGMKEHKTKESGGFLHRAKKL